MNAIERAKVGKWEKVQYLVFLGVFFPAFLIWGLLDGLGFSLWARTGITLFIYLGLSLLLNRPAAAERRRRLDSEFEQGIFDCAIRFANASPGSLRDMWENGAAQQKGQELDFQTQMGDLQPSPAGRKRTYAILEVVDRVKPVKKPLGWHRGWSIAVLRTNKGMMHLAAG
ncbi:hypothetical protein IWX64_003214 [Arthrobacter sp. CAN_A212]|uniref:hypothetical protein n=1 Tax=unclassified Arthrobacter TaxID=235627 RepID=UPI0018C9B108|nr:hypothetical protein [Arthrobacter sp. CAN_C5]MBP2217902.1 hypothetical protein [Arthrobacter sp. CAN_C5]